MEEPNRTCYTGRETRQETGKTNLRDSYNTRVLDDAMHVYSPTYSSDTITPIQILEIAILSQGTTTHRRDQFEDWNSRMQIP